MVRIFNYFGWEHLKAIVISLFLAAMAGLFFQAVRLPMFMGFGTLSVGGASLRWRLKSQSLNRNLNWINSLPLSRRSLWLVHYALGWATALVIVFLVATAMLLQSNSEGESLKDQPAVTSTLDHLAIFGTASMIPYFLFIVFLVHAALMTGASGETFHRDHWQHPNREIRLRYRLTLFLFCAYSLIVFTFPETRFFHVTSYLLMSVIINFYSASHSVFALKLPRNAARRWFWGLCTIGGTFLALGLLFVQ